MVTQKYNLFIIIISLCCCASQHQDEPEYDVAVPQHRIISRRTVKTNMQFRYQAALILHKVDTVKLGFCSGALITTTFVLTAAHCLLQKTSIEVALGVPVMDRINRSFYFLETKKFRPHPEFKDFGHNDVGLVQLPKSVELNNRVSTVKLPTFSNETRYYYGETAIMSGWVKSVLNSLDNKLNYMKVMIQTEDECHFAINPNKMICGEGEDTDRTCKGDSGAPLVIQDLEHTFTLIGVASFGDKKCRLGYPTVYARVENYLKWIARYSDYKL